jgi:hypothetical protein
MANSHPSFNLIEMANLRVQGTFVFCLRLPRASQLRRRRKSRKVTQQLVRPFHAAGTLPEIGAKARRSLRKIISRGLRLLDAFPSKASMIIKADDGAKYLSGQQTLARVSSHSISRNSTRVRQLLGPLTETIENPAPSVPQNSAILRPRTGPSHKKCNAIAKQQIDVARPVPTVIIKPARNAFARVLGTSGSKIEYSEGLSRLLFFSFCSQGLLPRVTAEVIIENLPFPSPPD